MRITPHGVEQNRQMHAAGQFGRSGDVHHWAKDLEHVAALANTTSILDYGCGSGALSRALPELPIREYDPCVPGKDAEPAPADIVVCCDALEHVEPECLGDVLDHIAALAARFTFLVVSLAAADKKLPDGRNTHLSLLGIQSWIALVNARFVPIHVQLLGVNLVLICRTVAEDERVREQGKI